jgi:Flp pilus assembly protein TadD
LVLQFTEHEWEAAQQRAAAMRPYNRGVDLLGQERWEEAETQFRAALDIAPDLANARYNLAVVLSKRAQYGKAAIILVDLLKQRPEDPDFLFAAGHVRFQQGHYGEAVRLFRSLLTVKPAHRRGAFGLARALQEAGRRGEAAQAWEEYLALDSTSSWADIARRNLQQIRSE